MSILDFLIGIIVYLVGVILAAILAAIVDVKNSDRTESNEPFLLCYGSYFTLLIFIVGLSLEGVSSFPKKIYDFIYDKLSKK